MDDNIKLKLYNIILFNSFIKELNNIYYKIKYTN